MKWQIIILMVLLLPIVMADQGEIEIFNPREVIDLSVHLTDSTGEVVLANCSVRIMNENYTLIENIKMEEIGNGWYNATYNTSETGYYLCRQNCTKDDDYIAGTCNFIIQGDENMPLTAIISLIMVILVYIALVFFFNSQIFSEHGLVKVSLIALIIWMMLIPVSFAMETVAFNGGSQRMADAMLLMFKVMTWINILFTFYMVLYLIVSFVRSMQENVKQ